MKSFMSRRLILPVSYVSLAIIMFCSCDFETIVNVDIPKTPPKLVVNSVLTTDSLIVANVTVSKNILEEQARFEVLTHAQVIVNSGDKTMILPFSQNGNYYLDDFTAKENTRYTLEISAAGYETVTASTVVPSKILIDKIEKGGKATDKNGNTGTIFWLYFQDPIAQTNFYRISMKSFRTFIRRPGEEFTTVNAHYLETTDPSISHAYGDLLFKDVLFNGKAHKIPILINDSDLTIWGTDMKINKLVFSLFSLNEDFYKYLETQPLQENVKGDPFAQPVLVHNNIKNGFGIFGGYSTSIMELEP